MIMYKVNAVLNGQKLVLQIHNEDLPSFEARHGPAYALYNKFAEGRWVVDDVYNVISFAYHPRPDKQPAQFKIDINAILYGRFGHKGLATPPKECPVQEALKSRPVAQYAILAQLILGAVLFGLDPSEAKFSDGSDG